MAGIWTRLNNLGIAENKPFLALAPLDGVTDFVFREIIAETAKPNVMFTEFTNTDALLSKGYDRTITRFRFLETQRPIVAQIWGTKPESFLKVATMVCELGFDGIDINMGCPDRTVLKIGAGAGHINDHGIASEIIAATKEGAKGLDVSVKTRIGINSIVTEEWASFLLTQKLAALTVHGRTAKEMSKVAAHWDEIAKVVKLRDQISSETVILGNGDITTREQALQAHKEFGVDGVMIGRGIFLNPWIFETSPREHSVKVHLELLLKHTKLYCVTYTYKNSFEVMKKFFKIYVKNFNGAGNLKTELMRTSSYTEVENLVKPYLDVL